ncbi:methylenetetrahydromethanopterin dehydrogenase [Azospirillum sp. RWY-5-1]|uniref:Methylenetetrahydromethanopterin dehydrogenase n=1 Tax=Azospirillum oleiclasticum TaxID=2735135 RepID=A0ABX2TFR0_9PROT|nr:NAD(P)-dependent methylenetetrahydromethanopterin dehydrogenase [Azospirillum oleiclasticum]NYZ14474.1 methylenetetrahydromethanopterin dehydrogenase [Azospirillum oleiclasticum]NYZ23174.1 methylenetetrahydromethanopterin dehydrogenase [Azospirillum oleiclasticum]
MRAPYILHMLTPLKHVSPFDVNMAADAGLTVLFPHTGVEAGEVASLTQDAMFSRDPANAARTGLFIGGRDALLALEMMDTARAAMFPPFTISVMVDPSGAFTTAAAMVAVVERALRRAGAADGLKGRAVQVYGATGVVGGIAGVMAAFAGARVTLVGHRGLEPVRSKADAFRERFQVELACADAPDDAGKAALLPDAEVVLACGRAGLQILSARHLAAAGRLLAAADVNAVPPPGIEGVAAKDDGAPLPDGRGVGIGALAVGNVKFRVQHALLKRMAEADAAVHLGIREAYDAAVRIAG